MSDNIPISRRSLLGAGAGVAAGLIANRLGAEAAPGAACGDPTVAQAEGPYYPTRNQPDEDADLTQVKGKAGRAKGEVIFVRGRVLDVDCQPVEGALVEIWQANAAGRYDHEGDAGNPRPLDPNFQSWAEVLTGKDGMFRFKTIKPGSYPADDKGWIRPPHIHFKVSRRSYHELVTQMYFEGEPLNEADQIRKTLSGDDQKRVTIAFKASPPDLEPGSRLGEFDITLRKA
jgi:protocatechuate 3,4-dioxygenase beta subunit